MLAVVLLLLPVRIALAADPADYVSRTWGREQGLDHGSIRSIAQTVDGYLWIGTDRTLLRFDGMRFEAMQLPGHEAIAPVLSLVVDSDGSLWIRTAPARLLRYRNGKFDVVLTTDNEAVITAVASAHPGGLLLTGLAMGTVRMTGATRVPIAPPSSMVLALAQTADGKIWLGTRESGLYFVEHGQQHRITANVPDNKINCLLPMRDGRMLIGTDGGIAVWNGHGVDPIAPPALQKQMQVLTLAEDQEDKIWVGTSAGLLQYDIATGVWIQMSHQVAVTVLYSDREGDIWFGDDESLSRIQRRRFAAVRTSGAGSQPGALYVDGRGRTWVAPLQGGLFYLENGVSHAVSTSGLNRDVVYSIDGSGDDIWLGRQRGGLTRLHSTGKGFEPTTWTTTEGLAQNSVYVVRVMHDGAVWAGTLTNGVSRLLPNGVLEKFGRTSGLGADGATTIEEGNDGTVWFGTPNGLRSFSRERWGQYGKEQGLHDLEILSTAIDNNGNVWIGTQSGLAYWNAHTGLIRAADQLAPLREPILGLAVTGANVLWIAADSRILSVSLDSLVGAEPLQGAVHSYAVADGLVLAHGVRRARSMMTDAAGNLWLSTEGGLAVAAAMHGAQPQDPVPHVEAITSDGVQLTGSPGVSVTAGSRRLTFSYTGVDLRAPEEVRFRYRLDGFDKGWSEATPEREAVYTNLPAGHFRFRVQAGDEDGNWNAEEGSLPLVVQPHLWDRWEFSLGVLCFLVCLAMWIFRLRTQHLVARANLRAEGRLVERTRIARELHDTLLQGFISALMHLNLSAQKLPEASETRQELDSVMTIMEDVIEEGRLAVEGLRSVDEHQPDLNASFSKLFSDLDCVFEGNHQIVVEGTPRSLHPAVFPDVLAIGNEAITNAIRHADAACIDVHLRYARGDFELSVTDDGRGISQEILKRGRTKHWGLAGMRERAKRVGATITIESSMESGTHLHLSVPATRAYPKVRCPDA